MDLSAIIFVVLAVAWAVYLIPKALKHHDEMASDRLVEGHSERVRVLSRHKTSVTIETTDEDVEVPRVDRAAAPVPAEVVEAPVARTPLVPTRASARRAARNRRRVLSVLLLATAVVAGLAGFAIVPWWSVAVPAALVVAFLVVARLSVRRMQRARRAVPLSPSLPVVEEGRQAPRETTTASQPSSVSQDLVDLLAEDPDAEQRQQAEAVLADDGSLWDPLPMTLPTYVNKARARRTVRTIELTGINSSGHDESDSALARDAAETADATEAAAEQRRVAGA